MSRALALAVVLACLPRAAAAAPAAQPVPILSERRRRCRRARRNAAMRTLVDVVTE